SFPAPLVPPVFSSSPTRRSSDLRLFLRLFSRRRLCRHHGGLIDASRRWFGSWLTFCLSGRFVRLCRWLISLSGGLGFNRIGTSLRLGLYLFDDCRVIGGRSIRLLYCFRISLCIRLGTSRARRGSRSCRLRGLLWRFLLFGRLISSRGLRWCGGLRGWGSLRRLWLRLFCST